MERQKDSSVLYLLLRRHHLPSRLATDFDPRLKWGHRQVRYCTSPCFSLADNDPSREMDMQILKDADAEAQRPATVHCTNNLAHDTWGHNSTRGPSNGHWLHESMSNPCLKRTTRCQNPSIVLKPTESSRQVAECCYIHTQALRHGTPICRSVSGTGQPGSRRLLECRLESLLLSREISAVAVKTQNSRNAHWPCAGGAAMWKVSNPRG
jgi:hypothetical protein